MNFWFHIRNIVFPKYTWRREVQEMVVYLTFDDGPHPSITPWVISELEKVGAKGTFFVVGDNVDKFPNVISELKSNGHSIGNHTQHHTKGWKVSKSEYLK
ncbi:MAG: polysaccharide deacetylase family protein, partial [Bacteroidia bacterium]